MRPDDDTATEVVVTVRLKMGQGPADPEAERVIALLEQLANSGTRRLAVTAGDDAGADEDADLTVFPESRTVYRGPDEVPLTRREFDLLLCLADSPHRAFTREQLMAKAWNTAYSGQRSVDVHVTRLRAKIGLDVPLVSTVRGIGYRLHGDAKVAVVRQL